MTIDTIVFDFGGVLIDWNPRHYYKNVFKDDDKMEWFLNNVCPPDWNLEQDRGRPFSEAIAIAKNKYPDLSKEIEDYYNQWEYMLNGEIPGTVQILNALAQNYKIYGLTNWSAETFPVALKKYSFLSLLDGIVVSGDEKLIKPDPQIFQVLLKRYNLQAESCVFIDDNLQNIETAKTLGFNAIHFTDAENLKKELASLNLNI